MAAPRVAIFGVGGVGGWLGTRLLEAGGQAAEVVLIARGDHGATIRERGLGLRVTPSDGGPVATVNTTPGAAEVYSSVNEALAQGARPVDFVILGVKTWQVEEAARAAGPLLGPNGCVVTTQNGVEAPRKAAEAVGAARVLGGVAKVLAFVSEPGVIEMKSRPAVLQFGEVFSGDGAVLTGAGQNPSSPRAERLAAVLAHCQGVWSGVAPAGMWSMIWEKAMIMCTIGPLGALCRAPLDKLCSIPETRAMLRVAMLEVARCTEASGNLPPDRTTEEMVDDTLAALTAQSASQPGITPSTLRDVVTGRPSEIHELSGGIVRAGRALGVDTPTHDLILAALLPQELRARGTEPYQLMGVPGGAPHVAADAAAPTTAAAAEAAAVASAAP